MADRYGRRRRTGFPAPASGSDHRSPSPCLSRRPSRFRPIPSLHLDRGIQALPMAPFWPLKCALRSGSSVGHRVAIEHGQLCTVSNSATLSMSFLSSASRWERMTGAPENRRCPACLMERVSPAFSRGNYRKQESSGTARNLGPSNFTTSLYEFASSFIWKRLNR